MTTATFPKILPGLTGPRSGKRELPSARLSTRVWNALVRAGERRAAAEIARHLQLYGGTATGDLASDIRQMAALRRVL